VTPEDEVTAQDGVGHCNDNTGHDGVGYCNDDNMGHDTLGRSGALQ
jgi:hypothetical protein